MGCCCFGGSLCLSVSLSLSVSLTHALTRIQITVVAIHDVFRSNSTCNASRDNATHRQPLRLQISKMWLLFRPAVTSAGQLPGCVSLCFFLFFCCSSLVSLFRFCPRKHFRDWVGLDELSLANDFDNTGPSDSGGLRGGEDGSVASRRRCQSAHYLRAGA